ncbi:hypothetical protein MAPG_05684, partial [Magnaporthiopsis poae ATCC 64411]|uniref:Uncharacterized protein n=1 Tax=Magnaporthiopsis poae (strain ATCC 64411 / 73-15) TaxID=644358 RepID=A0A0C4E018_MAGP6
VQPGRHPTTRRKETRPTEGKDGRPSDARVSLPAPRRASPHGQTELVTSRGEGWLGDASILASPVLLPSLAGPGTQREHGFKPLPPIGRTGQGRLMVGENTRLVSFHVCISLYPGEAKDASCTILPTDQSRLYGFLCIPSHPGRSINTGCKDFLSKMHSRFRAWPLLSRRRPWIPPLLPLAPRHVRSSCMDNQIPIMHPPAQSDGHLQQQYYQIKSTVPQSRGSCWASGDAGT